MSNILGRAESMVEAFCLLAQDYEQGADAAAWDVANYVRFAGMVLDAYDDLRDCRVHLTVLRSKQRKLLRWMNLMLEALPKEVCKHKPDPLSDPKRPGHDYVAWHADADERRKMGEQQLKCPVCNRWIWEYLWDREVDK